SKSCHAVAPCSLTNAGEEGNGGKEFICCDCWLNIHIDTLNGGNIDNSNPTISQQIDARETSQTPGNNDDPNDEPTPSLSSRKRRQQLTIKDKLDILDFAKNSSIHASSKHFNVDRQNIREWMKQEQNLRESLDSAAKRKRLIGGGRKLSNANFDKSLADWVKELREKNLRVTRNT
uniref:BrkDBD domain-containing protein n=1 Tax=Globodera pallida TaxID=36090 RepID=A0A183CTC0_GLOPA